MAKISGIYVEIRGDSTQLSKDLATARQHVTEQATGMSNALNNALSPAQLKNNINGIVRNLNTLSQASKLTGKEFGAIGADLKDLQRLTGISEKAFRDLQSRMLQTSAAKDQEKALQSIARAAGLSAKEVERLGKQMDVSASSIAAVNGAAKSSASAMDMLGSAAKASLAYFSVQTVVEFGRAVMDAGLAMDSLQRSFVAVTGSQAGATETLSFLREESERLGQNFYALAPEFKNVMAAARGTAMEGENVRKMFSAIAGASTALGLSVDDTHGTLRALQQMMSKGTIQAEELRGQLGERLPGALNLMAKAMGVSTAELNKMMEDGKLLADDALPKLTIAIEEMYGAAAEKAALESGRAAVNRLSQAWEELKISLFDNQAFVVAANSIRLLVTAASKAVGAWTIKEQLVAAQNELKGLEQIDGTPMATLPGFQSRLEATSKEVARLKDELLQFEKPATDAFLAMTKGLEQAENRAGDYISYLQDADQKLEKLLQTDRDKIDATYRELSGKVKDQAALEKWYAGEVAKLNEKSTKKFADEQKKQLEAHKKAREAMLKGGKDAEQAIEDWQEKYDKRRIDAIAESTAKTVKMRVDAEKEAADAARKIAEEQEAAAQKVMDRIQEGTADVFYDMFQDIGKGWENLWESMKNWALRTLAELAARAATVNIVVPIMMSITGTSDAGAAVNSLTGGGSGIGNLGQLVSSSGIMSKIPGYNTLAAYGGMMLPGTVSLSGGALALQSGMTAGGEVASLAAAQNLSGLTGGLSISSALGSGVLGSLGYTMIGGELGLPQNQYSGLTAGIGGTLGAWGGSALGGMMGGAMAGSVLPVVGTIAGAVSGGLASSLLSSGDTTSPSVLINRNTNLWGDTSVIGEGVTGASQDQAAGIASMLGQYMATQYQAVEQTLSVFGKQYVDLLQGQTISFGRNTPGNTFSWDWGADKDAEKVTAEAQAILQQKIYEAASAAFNAAGRDIVESGDATQALSMLSDYAADSLRTMMDAISAGVQSGDIETFTAQVQSLQQTIKTINETWSSISQGANDLVAPPSAYESAVRQANAQFDGWLATMDSMGFAEDRVREIEEKRIQALMRLNMEMGPLAEAEASAVAARNKAEVDALGVLNTARENLMDAYQRESAELQKVISTWSAFADSLKSWRDNFMSSDNLPTQARSIFAQRNWDMTYKKALVGDQEAVGGLTQVADEQLLVARMTAETQEDYLRTAFKTYNAIGDVENLAARHVAIAENQLKALQYEMQFAQAEYYEIVNQGKTTMTMKDALVELKNAYLNYQSIVTKNKEETAASAATPLWTEAGYLAANPDVAAAVAIGDFISGMQHWLMYGQYESRTWYDSIQQRASGGYTHPGLTLVGEEGPELVNFNRPSMVYDAQQTRELLTGGRSNGTSSEIRALRDDLRSIGRALAKNTLDTAKLLKRWDGDGMPEERVVA